MTVAEQGSQSTFLGNGSTTAFSFPWSVDSAADVNVYYIGATGAQTLLTSSEYLITLNAVAPGQLWAVGGTVNYPLSGSPIAAGTQLLVQRAVPYEQGVNIANQTFYPTSVQEGLDLLEFQIQQLAARTGQLRGNWTTATFYNIGDIVVDGPNGTDTGNLYMCANANTSTVWATDLAAGDWSLALNIQSIVNATPTIGNNNIFGNISGVPATPTGVTLTALIDSAISSTRGSLLYRNASGWVALSPGTNGYVLTTQGAAADPVWGVTGGGGSGTVTSVASGTGLTGGPITSSGTLSLASVADNSLLANASGGAAAPSATTLSAFIDHVISSTQGSILYRNASIWTALGPGTSGQVLTTQGAAANPHWSSASSGLVLLATTVASSASSVVFNSTYITSTYSKYIVEINGLLAPNGGTPVDFYLTLSTNNGSAYLGGTNYNWGGMVVGTNASAPVSYNNSGDSQFNVSLGNTNVGGTAAGNSQFTITLSNPSASQTLLADWRGVVNAGPHGGFFTGGGISASTTAINAIKFTTSAGTFSGTFKLYGLS